MQSQKQVRRASNIMGLKTMMLVLVFAFTVAGVQLSDDDIIDLTQTKMRCGNKLNNALKNVCKLDVSQIKGMTKRSVKRSMFDSQSMSDELQGLSFNDGEGYEDFNTQTGSLDDAMFQSEFIPMYPNHRQRRGIIQECCKSPCSFQKLIQYCPPKY